MKSYLELASISARVHRRQSRMTRVCILLAVFLVTAIFGMADMELQSQRIQAIQQYGSWHAVIKDGISESDSALIASRPELVQTAWYGAKNTNLHADFSIGGRPVAVCGCDEAWLSMFPGVRWLEGGYPTQPDTISLTENAQTLLGVGIGDTVTLDFPNGSATLRVTGLLHNTAMMNERDGVGLLFSLSDYRRYFSGIPDAAPWFYLELSPLCNMQRTLTAIQNQFGLSEEQLAQNPKLMGLSGQSLNSYMQKLYAVAAVLTLLIVTAGVLMITSSLNSSVAQRTERFGLLRCLGATNGQIRKFVRQEALRWCRTAVPAGLLAGVGVVWLLCALLRTLVPTYFDAMPRFGISPVALASGAAVGMLTVLLAAQAPAKRAAAVSPLAAVSGIAGTVQAAGRAANTRLFRVDTALGIHHATGSLRNFALTAGSFAFSIVLFLSFHTAVGFMQHAITPLQPSAPDFSVISTDQDLRIPTGMADTFAALPAVKRVYGRSLADGLEGQSNGQTIRLRLISYEAQQFQWARKARLDGTLTEAEDGKGLLLAYSKDSPLQTGDFLTIGGYALPICGRLRYSQSSPEADTITLFCSESLFQRLTGESDYAVLDVQLTHGASDTDVAALRTLAGEGFHFSDRRLSNQEAFGAYASFAIFLYGFLAVIALISIFHILNSISMNTAARLRQYAAMHAVGMATAQLTRMIAAEALTYALSGALLGTVLGLPLHRLLFSQLVTSQWGDQWAPPWRALLVILLTVLGASALAVALPARRMQASLSHGLHLQDD